MSWNLRQIREPGLAHLLPPASLIQFDHEIRVFNFKISRRIVEGEVPILTNAQKGDINRRRSQCLSLAAHDFGDITIAIQQVIVGNSSFLYQLLQQHLPEAARMINRKADVFVQMKNLNPRPVDAWLAGKRVQKLELRRSRRGNDPRVPMFANRSANGGHGLLGSGFTQGSLVVK